MLAVARAPMDEPIMGLSPLLVAKVGKIVQDINADGTSILSYDHIFVKGVSLPQP